MDLNNTLEGGGQIVLNARHKLIAKKNRACQKIMTSAWTGPNHVLETTRSSYEVNQRLSLGRSRKRSKGLGEKNRLSIT